MKRIFFRVIGVIGVAAFAVVVALNVNAGLKSDAESDIMLANVEALLQGESHGSSVYCCSTQPTCHSYESGGQTVNIKGTMYTTPCP
jgi:hypothetical protein